MSDKLIRVLVVNSIDDDITRRRLEWLASRDMPARLRVSHCYAMGAMDRSASEASIRTRISDAIVRVRPHYLLVHRGMAYRNNPDGFDAALRSVKRLYPTIRIGIEDQDERDLEKGIYSSRGKIVPLLDLLFGWRRRPDTPTHAVPFS